MSYDPTGAQFGDVVTNVRDSTDRLVYLPASDDTMMPWLDPETGDWYDADNINWDQIRRTHRLVPADGGDSDA